MNNIIKALKFYLYETGEMAFATSRGFPIVHDLKNYTEVFIVFSVCNRQCLKMLYYKLCITDIFTKYLMMNSEIVYNNIPKPEIKPKIILMSYIENSLSI